jgi:hypothetical protein
MVAVKLQQRPTEGGEVGDAYKQHRRLPFVHAVLRGSFLAAERWRWLGSTVTAC